MASISIYKDVSTGINYSLIAKDNKLTLWGEQLDGDDVIDVAEFVIEDPENIAKITKEICFLEMLKNTSRLSDLDIITDTIFSASKHLITNFKKLATGELNETGRGK